MHIGQIEVEQDDVVIVELAQIEAFLAKIGGVDIEALGPEHQFDALGDGRFVLDQQNPHIRNPCSGRRELADKLRARNDV